MLNVKTAKTSSAKSIDEKSGGSKSKIAKLIGQMFALQTSLKLYHWNITGTGSYAQHIAIDEAIDSLSESMDSIAETVIADYGTLNIVVPECVKPDNITKFVDAFYEVVDSNRSIFSEIFMQSIIDDYQQALKQLNYRLKRLS